MAAVWFGGSFLGLAGALVWLACLVPAAWGWLCAWTAVACALAGSAWLSGSPASFGKRADGRRTVWSTVPMLPFLLPLWAWWHVVRPWRREPPWHQLTPTLCLGRRLLDREFRASGLVVDHLVDLTCEYAERPQQRAHPGYLCLPIVDGLAPSPAVFVAYVEQLQALPGRVFLHCAEGHGRTATMAAALLLVTGAVADPAAALARVRAGRPLARPYRQQVAALERFWNEWRRSDRLTVAP